MCFTKPVKYSYFYFATLFPIIWEKQTVTESTLSRKTVRVCTSLWLPWWHMSHGECLPANPRAMQMSKKHKVLVRILCMLTALKKIAILSFSSFTVRQTLFCFVIHERFPLISLRNGSVTTWEHPPGLCAVLDILVCLFTDVLHRVRAPCLRGNCYFSKEGSNIYLLISQCIPPWPFLDSSRGLQDWNTDDPQNTTSCFSITVIYTVSLPKM